MEISRNCGRASDFHRRWNLPGSEPVRPYEKMAAALAMLVWHVVYPQSLWKFLIGRPIEESVCFVWASLFSVIQFFVVLFVAAGFSLRTFSRLSLNAAFVNGVVSGIFFP